MSASSETCVLWFRSHQKLIRTAVYMHVWLYFVNLVHWAGLNCQCSFFTMFTVVWKAKNVTPIINKGCTISSPQFFIFLEKTTLKIGVSMRKCWLCYIIIVDYWCDVISRWTSWGITGRYSSRQVAGQNLERVCRFTMPSLSFCFQISLQSNKLKLSSQADWFFAN